ncbi:MAG: SDR family NAD(P)-dependent oxidoreductase [Candidatus Hodarchaeales archaeon]
MGTDLRNLVAIITGAAQGMGQAVAERFAEEGAILILTDIQQEKLKAVAVSFRERNINARDIHCDVSEEKQVQQLVSAVLSDLGRIDILVNCAGIIYPTRFHNMTIDEWDRVLAINLGGTFLLMRAVYPHMKAQGDGRIINFASTAGLTVSTFGGAHYTASKHAVIGLTKAVAKEGGSFGVRVNAVCPGLIDTEMVRGWIDESALQKYEQSFPIARLGDPRDVAELVLYLASDRSAYITGASINISGGDFLL